jgi:transcriptional regulator with GAF, ATPase, and Fis domain
MMNCWHTGPSLRKEFGYEKGAFTGAVMTQRGRFKLADGGMPLLDEVVELSLKSQVDFLRVLETKGFRRLGETKPLKVDFRIIAATNRNLEEAVNQGAFEKTSTTFNVPPIKLPPILDRSDDIPLLLDQFLTECALLSITVSRRTYQKKRCGFCGCMGGPETFVNSGISCSVWW